jgi:arylsulfatase A-like enzyme
MLMLTLCCFGSVLGAERPNVLFIAVDDLRPEFGAYGADYVRSPNLDRIAKSGMTFQRAYCQQAVCSPTRSSLMTGTRPDTTRVWDLNTHFRTALPNVVTLGEHFKNNGYFVQGMGKIYHGGFDDPQTWSVPWTSPKGKAYGLEENIALNSRSETKKNNGKKSTPRNSRGPAYEGADVPDDTFHDGKLAEMAIATLQRMDAQRQPFFLAVGFVKPHLPFVAPKKYYDLYDPTKIQLATNPFRPKDAPEYSIQPGGELRSYHGIPEGPIPQDLARNLKHGYYAAISYMDAQVGKVLDEMDRLNLTKNTIIVLWGDHGWKLGEHDAWCKHSNCENDTNAALLVSVPGMKHAGAKTKGIVEFVDIYPTLADLVGLRLPSHLEGISFRGLLENPNQAWKQASFSQYPRSIAGKQLMGYSMRTDRYRLTVWVDRNDREQVEARELYDHEIDPQENQNIANQVGQKAVLERLMAQWRAGWQAAKPASSAP